MIWKELIQSQIDNHKRLNLLALWQKNGFRFTDTTREIIKRIALNSFSAQQEQEILSYTTKATLSSLYRVNQYYQFDEQAEEELEHIYRQLLSDIKSGDNDAPNFDVLAATHYLRLQKWLKEKQADVIAYYSPAQPLLQNTVVCAEYSVLTQLNTLGIDIANLQEPILDVGCGKEHYLTTYLQQKGFDIYGIDREAIPGNRVSRGSWLNYEFKPHYWGTIISHLGFTNHFNHHHLKAQSDHILYAKKYVEILESLKINGTFHYAPDLPFIEAYLSTSQYSIKKKQVPQTCFYATSIERLK